LCELLGIEASKQREQIVRLLRATSSIKSSALVAIVSNNQSAGKSIAVNREALTDGLLVTRPSEATNTLMLRPDDTPFEVVSFGGRERDVLELLPADTPEECKRTARLLTDEPKGDYDCE